VAKECGTAQKRSSALARGQIINQGETSRKDDTQRSCERYTVPHTCGPCCSATPFPATRRKPKRTKNSDTGRGCGPLSCGAVGNKLQSIHSTLHLKLKTVWKITALIVRIQTHAWKDEVRAALVFKIGIFKNRSRAAGQE